MQILMIIRFQL